MPAFWQVLAVSRGFMMDSQLIHDSWLGRETYEEMSILGACNHSLHYLMEKLNWLTGRSHNVVCLPHGHMAWHKVRPAELGTYDRANCFCFFHYSFFREGARGIQGIDCNVLEFSPAWWSFMTSWFRLTTLPHSVIVHSYYIRYYLR